MKSLKADPRAQALPLGAQLLWHRTLDVMHKLDQAVLQVAEHIPSIPELAGMLKVRELELEAYLPILQTWGLLVPDMRGALYAPLVLKAQQQRQALAERRRQEEEAAARGEDVPSARVRASRENGARGGRPSRSGSNHTQRQMPLLHVVAGADGNPTGSGEANPTGSFSQTQRVSSSSALALALAEAEAKTQTQVSERTGFSEVGAGARAGDDETQETQRDNLDAKPRPETHGGQDVDVAAFTRELQGIAGLSPNPTKPEMATVRGWLTDGYRPETIRDVVRAVTADVKEPIRHLGYFKEPMKAAIVAQAGGSASGSDAVAASPTAEDRRTLPQQPGESEDVYMRRTRGLPPMKTPPLRTEGESDVAHGRRVRSRYDIERKTARSYSVTEPDWDAYASAAGLPFEIAEQLAA